MVTSFSLSSPASAICLSLVGYVLITFSSAEKTAKLVLVSMHFVRPISEYFLMMRNSFVHELHNHDIQSKSVHQVETGCKLVLSDQRSFFCSPYLVYCKMKSKPFNKRIEFGFFVMYMQSVRMEWRAGKS